MRVPPVLVLALLLVAELTARVAADVDFFIEGEPVRSPWVVRKSPDRRFFQSAEKPATRPPKDRSNCARQAATSEALRTPQNRETSIIPLPNLPRPTVHRKER